MPVSKCRDVAPIDVDDRLDLRYWSIYKDYASLVNISVTVK